MSDYGEKEYARLMKLPRNKRSNEGSESDIFGGKTWTKEEQFEYELESFKYQMKYTIQSYRRLKKGEWKKIQEFINGIER